MTEQLHALRVTAGDIEQNLPLGEVGCTGRCAVRVAVWGSLTAASNSLAHWLVAVCVLGLPIRHVLDSPTGGLAARPPTPSETREDVPYTPLLLLVGGVLLGEHAWEPIAG
jgi:hypothetical protein